MSAPYTGNPANATDTIELFDGLDRPTAQSVIVPLQRLLDGVAARRLSSLRIDTLQLREVRQEGVTISDVTEVVSAVQRNQGTPLVVCKATQAFGLGDSSRLSVQGVPTDITTSVFDAATDGSRIVICGNGGNKISYSDDDGATWTQGANPGSAPTRLFWNDTLGLFLACRSSFVSRSADGAAAWADNTGGIVVGEAGLAIMSDGSVYCIRSGAANFAKSTDGIAFADTASGAPGVGVDLDDVGSLAGNAGSIFYYASRHNSGARIEIHTSTDGATFTLIATLTPQGSATFASQPRLLMCQNTGVLVLVAPTSGNQCALYASLDGISWAGPNVLFPNPTIRGFALAGGRLFYTFNDMIFASDGAGY